MPRLILSILAAIAPALWAQPAAGPADDPTGAVGAEGAEETGEGGEGGEEGEGGEDLFRLSRVVASFDFEEKMTNALPVPAGWYRGQSDERAGRVREGFPIWNQAELDYDSPASQGEGSVRLPTSGGSTSLMLKPGIIPVLPGSDHIVIARLRTQGLERAHARLRTRLLGQDLDPIEGTERDSGPLVSEGSWSRVSVEAPGLSPEAAYLQIELLVLQPEREESPSAVGEFEINLQDLDAAAWFDEIAVITKPRVELSTDRPAQLFSAPDRPEIDLVVRDTGGDTLMLEATVEDAWGRRVDTLSRRFRGGEFATRWAPALDRLGWYRVTLEVSTGGRTVASERLAFAWLPEPGSVIGRGGPDRQGVLPGAMDLERFGLETLRTGPAVREGLPEIARLAGVGAVTVDVFDAIESADQARAWMETLDPAINGLLDAWRRVTLVLGTLPDPVAEALGIEPPRVIEGVSRDPERMGPLVDPLLDRYGERVRRWRLGNREAGRPVLEDLEAAESFVGAHTPGLILGTPWRSDRVPPDWMVREDRSLETTIAPGSGTESYEELALRWSAHLESSPRDPNADPSDRPEQVLRLDPLRPGRFAPIDIARWTARHTIAFWTHFAGAPVEGDRADAMTTLSLVDPWLVVGGDRPRLEPDPSLPVFRSLIERLADRRVVRTLEPSPGVTLVVLAPAEHARDDRGGAIALFTDRSAVRSVPMYLGEENPRLVDLFGNARPLEVMRGDGVPPHHLVPVSDIPVFVEGVDPRLLDFQTSLRIEPGLLSTRTQHVDGAIVVSNPWDIVLRGSVAVADPVGEGWRFSPRRSEFAIAPGDTVRLPMTINFSIAEEAGIRPMVLEVRLDSGVGASWFSVTTPVEVGLPGYELDLSPRVVASADPEALNSTALVVHAGVTNQTDRSVTAQLFAIAPGRARERRTIADLGPGERVVHPFVFTDAVDLRGERVRVSMRLLEEDGRLTKSILVE